MLFRLIYVVLGVTLVGCASLHDPAPNTYKGPMALVTDSGFHEDNQKAQLFLLQEVDGKTINNAIFESRRASQNRGFAVSASYTQRVVPALPMKVKLVATHFTAAPILQIASRAAGTFLSVEGVVDFTPVAGGDYIVKGELKKGGSAVWIEDKATNLPVTTIVRSQQ